VVVVDLAERLVLELKHQAGVVVEADQFRFATSLLHCLEQPKLLRLEAVGLVVLP
jgi:hypothetical protein